MKIAICFSGQPRVYYPRAYNSIKEKLLDKYDCDIFMHCWYSPEEKEYSCAPWSGSEKFSVDHSATERLLELYKPKKYSFEPSLSRDDIVTRRYSRVLHESVPYNLISMYKSLKKSHDLMEGYLQEHPEVEYTFVIRSRFDGDILRMPPLRLLNPQKTYYINWGDNQKKQGLANNFFIANYPDSKICFNLINRMDELYDLGVLLNDEQICYGNILTSNVKNNLVLFNTDVFEVELVRK